MTVCKVCNQQFKKITTSHLSKHNLSYQDYLKLSDFQVEEICIYENKHTNWKCQNARIDGSEFCILHDRSLEKDIQLFSKELDTLIEKQGSNSNTELIHLDGINFPDDLSFEHLAFNKRIYFNEAIFNGKLTLFKIDFNKGVSFQLCAFKQEVYLGAVEIKETVKFSHCVFEKEATFHDIKFHGVTFVRAVFNSNAFIRHCVFHDFASFRHIKIPSSNSMLFFYFNQFPSEHQTWFEGNDMSKISFLYCDLRFIKFLNVLWASPKWPSLKRKCLIDEFVDFREGRLTPQHLSIVKTEYQQLKMNFEESRDFSRFF